MTLAFDGIGGFTTGMSKYAHTIFRFPLRRSKSGISEECFTISKLQKLLEALKEEAYYMLLFLRSVVKICVSEINERGEHTKTFEVGIECSDSESHMHEKKRFLDETAKLSSVTTKPHTLPYVYTSNFEVKTSTKSCIESKHFLTVSIVGSGNADVWLAANEQHVLPWVGCALEVNGHENMLCVEVSGSDTVSKEINSWENSDRGRLFCFLPLPKEASSPLPVHVNATFGLNDDRRSLKWPSEERIDDKVAEWNITIIKHLLPLCYATLILKVIELKTSYKHVYSAWPQVSKMNEDSNWSGLMEPLMKILFEKKIFWSKNYLSVQDSSVGNWIAFQKATFIAQGQRTCGIRVLLNVLSQCGLMLVDVPCHIWEVMERSNTKEKINTLSPVLTCRVLQKHLDKYKNLTYTDKLDLLEYILSDKQYEELNGLQLMPTVDKTFKPFNCGPYYVCSKRYSLALLPNMKGCLVDLSKRRPGLHEKLLDVAKTRKTKLECLDENVISKHLPLSMMLAWNRKTIVLSICTKNSHFPKKWLKIFWEWVQKYSLDLFEEQQVLPIPQSSKSSSDLIRVTKLSRKAFAIRITESNGISPDLLSGLRRLGLYFTGSTDGLFSYLNHKDLVSYVQPFNAGGVLTALANLYKGRLDVLIFEDFSFQEIDKMQHFFSEENLNEAEKEVLKYLPIFKRAGSSEGYYSVVSATEHSWNKKAVLEDEIGDLIDQNLYPPEIVVFSKENNFKLLSYFVEISTPNQIQFVLDYLVPIITSELYPLELLDRLMEKIFQQLQSLKRLAFRLQRLNELKTVLSNLHFLRCGMSDDGNTPLQDSYSNRQPPKDLYSNDKEEMTVIFKGQPVFPQHPFNQPHILINLNECHLRSSVTAQGILDVICTICDSKTVTQVEVERVKGILDYLDKHPDCLSTEVQLTYAQHQGDGTLKYVLSLFSKEMCWLPIEIYPLPNYPDCLEWKGRSPPPLLTSVNQATCICTAHDMKKYSSIAGSQVYIVKLPKSICDIFMQEIPLEHVIKHFETVIDNCENIVGNELDNIVIYM